MSRSAEWFCTQPRGCAAHYLGAIATAHRDGTLTVNMGQNAINLTGRLKGQGVGDFGEGLNVTPAVDLLYRYAGRRAELAPHLNYQLERARRPVRIKLGVHLNHPRKTRRASRVKHGHTFSVYTHNHRLSGSLQVRSCRRRGWQRHACQPSVDGQRARDSFACYVKRDSGSLLRRIRRRVSRPVSVGYDRKIAIL